MKFSSIYILFVTGMILGFVSCQETQSKNAANNEVVKRSELVQRGEYLVTVMGCNDCHSPKKFGPKGIYPDSARLLSGHPANLSIGRIDTSVLNSWTLANLHNTAFVGPWGVSYAANLTADASGIGNWTEAQFARAMREGKFKGLANSRELLPPMPWPMYKRLSDEDLRAIFAFLQSTKPIQNVVPAPTAMDKLQTLTSVKQK